MPPRCQLLSGSLPAPYRLLRNPQSARRTFATTTALSVPKGGDLGSHLPKHVIPQDAKIPPYPHGASLLFKQSNKGLYGGQMIQFGNNVSPDSKTKTRRYWKPNILQKSLYSVALKKRIKLRLTSKVLKTMDREGGLDEYLLKESEARIKELGPMGWALRWTLMQTPVVIARFRAEAAAIGLAQDIIDKQWPITPLARKESKEVRSKRLAVVQSESAQAAGLAQRKRESFEKANWLSERTSHYAQQLMEKRKIDKKLAEDMARLETNKMLSVLKLTGDKRTAYAYMRAEREGKVDRAGGREAWLAKYLAPKMLGRQKYEEARRKKEEAAEQAKQREERASWDALAKANAGPAAPATV